MQRVFVKKSASYFCRQMNSNSTTEMKELAARICKDYLHGAWKFVNAQNIGLKHIRWVSHLFSCCRAGVEIPEGMCGLRAVCRIITPEWNLDAVLFSYWFPIFICKQ